MILYSKNLKSLQALKAEKANVMQQVKATGWKSPFSLSETSVADDSPPPSPLAAPIIKSNAVPKEQMEEEKEDTAAKSFTAGTIFSMATNLLIQPAVSRMLSSYVFGKNNRLGNKLIQGVLPAAAGIVTPKSAIKVVSDIIGGFAKWKALELTVSLAQHFVAERKKNKKSKVQRAKKKALKTTRQIQRQILERKKKLMS